METVSFTRQLSVAENVDVLVVGAGPAGIGLTMSALNWYVHRCLLKAVQSCCCTPSL